MTEGQHHMPTPGDMARRPIPGPPPRIEPGPQQGEPGRAEASSPWVGAGSQQGEPGSAEAEPGSAQVGTGSQQAEAGSQQVGTEPGPTDVDEARAPVTGGTGDDRVDAALRRLESVEESPVSEHVAQYDAVHRSLQDALATIDEG